VHAFFGQDRPATLGANRQEDDDRTIVPLGRRPPPSGLVSWSLSLFVL
jgi:hypothetical protein